MEQPPPPVQMVQLLAGFQVSQALYAAARLGLPDQLVDGPRTAAEVAASLSADADSVARLSRILTGLGVLAQSSPGTYSLTPLGRTLTSDDPGSMRDLALMWMETHYAPFAGLADGVLTGRTAAETYYGKPFFGWLGQHPEQVMRFTGAMANLTNGIKRAALAGHDFTGARRIVDVGGADGTVLAHVLGRLPGATGVSFDLSHVVPAVEPLAKSLDLADRLSGEAGDFFESVPAGADTYLMSMVLHDWDDEHARTILANIATAGASGARVCALELVLPEGDEPHMAKMIDLTMLGMLGGRERTEPELRHLFDSAGLRYERTVATPTPLSFIEARVS
jgi:O-methyltransferase/methyltransferase family protein